MTDGEFTADDMGQMFPEMFEKDTRSFQLASLKARHHRMIDLHLYGYKNTEIATTLNVTAVSVANCLDSELGLQSIDDRRGRADEAVAEHQEQVERIVEKSLALVENILDGEDKGASASINLQAKTAIDMLKKKLPDVAVVKHESNINLMHQTNIQAIINRGAEVDAIPFVQEVKEISNDKTNEDS